ncbi:MAG TPA: ABC transporter substrate-binding protein, partial [Alphaproteobacteria bacterium]
RPNKPVKIRFNTTNGVFPNDFEMARAIAQMWKKVGIEADLQVIELAQYYELNHSGKMPEATLYRWGNDTGDPEIYTGYILNPKLPFSTWKSDDVGELVGKLFNETNYDRRIEGYRDLNKFVVEKGYAMPLLQGVSTVVYRETVDYKPYANGWIYPPALGKK